MHRAWRERFWYSINRALSFLLGSSCHSCPTQVKVSVIGSRTKVGTIRQHQTDTLSRFRTSNLRSDDSHLCSAADYRSLDLCWTSMARTSAQERQGTINRVPKTFFPCTVHSISSCPLHLPFIRTRLLRYSHGCRCSYPLSVNR